ncbi:tetratricopeptide repeat protein [Dyadobacter sp. CY323]|uniref:tetratricopeptide repeat protein n=1 Tax=Dyadobacter sp. CY323 TaxID=2907302 RepID=UPI001F355192|nr:tetratricopeptide repeat protein [Dyadobacter sp. CY323]MCE6988294.1 tetratricopeptide repeat protein [Dyadobacter sp. CY323]
MRIGPLNFTNTLRWIRAYPKRFVIAISLLLGFLANLDSSLALFERLTPLLPKDKEQFPNFSLNNGRDSLFVLVTRFENFDSLHPTNCFGQFLVSRINHNAEQGRLPIKAIYVTDAPQSSKESDALQSKYNADVTLWGSIQNLRETCAEGDICFKSNASKALINLAGGNSNLVSTEVVYQKGLTPSDMELGNFHIKEKRFDSWLLTVYNFKVGLANPDLYVVDTTLSDVEQSDSFVEKSYLFEMLKKANSALHSANQAVACNPKNVNARVQRASLNFDNNDLFPALADLNYAIKLEPRTSIYALRAIVKVDLGLKEAIADFDTAIIRERVEHKLTSLSKGMSKDTSSIRWLSAAYQIKASVHRTYREYDLALQSLDSAQVLNPKSASINVERAFCYRKLEQDKNALKEFKKAIQKEPSVEAYRGRASILNSMGKSEEALDDLTYAISISPKNADSYVDRGRIKEELDDIVGASKDYNQAILLQPSNSLAFLRRGNMRLFSTYDYWGAVSDLDRVLKLSPALPIISKGNLAFAYLSAGDHMAVLSAVNWDLRMGNRASELYYYLGRAHLAMKDTLAAIENFQKVMSNGQITFVHFDAMEKLALIYYDQRKYDQSRILFEDLAILRPKHYICHLISKLYLSRHEYGRALNWINKAIALDDSIGRYYILRMYIYQSALNIEGQVSAYPYVNVLF